MSLSQNQKNGAELRAYLKDKSISFAGNAVSLLQQGYGERIDSNDVVIRCNKGHYFIPGNEKALGKRTDVLMIARPVEQLEKLKLQFLIYICGKKECVERFSEICSLPYVGYFSQEYRRVLADSHFEGCWPTVGTTVFDFLYEEVEFASLDIFGFDFFTSPSLFMHSKGQWDNNMLRWHKPDLEQVYMMERINSGKKAITKWD